MESKLNGIEMRKFETKEELVEWIEIIHLQNTNGRETEEEMFRLGIEAAIEELSEFNLFSIPVVLGRSEQLEAFDEVFQLAWELVQEESDYTRLLKIKESL